MLWLLSLNVFFFFKQKTAYELRISDWSSDVCSSDLGDAVGVGAARQFGGQGQCLRLHGVGADLNRASRRCGLGRLAAGGEQRCEQIGRASCRERVCQYV